MRYIASVPESVITVYAFLDDVMYQLAVASRVVASVFFNNSTALFSTE